MRRPDDFLVLELVRRGLVSEEEAAHASETGDDHAARVLVTQGIVSSRDVALTAASIAETPFVDLARYDVSHGNASLLPRAIAESHTAFPLFVFDEGVVVGVADPMDYRGLDQIRQRLSVDVDAVVCEPELLKELIERAYRGTSADVQTSSDTPATVRVDENDPVVATVQDLVNSAIAEGASDIHLGPDDGRVFLRYRIDGVLQNRQAPPRSMHDAVVRRIKVLAKMDLTQTRKPLDGKIAFAYQGESVDLRVSVLPTVWGENVVIRVLRRASELGSFESLGMPGPIAESMTALTAKPHGMILVTGPTGSGKSTTLYSALSMLNSPDRNVMTIEDPVEVRLPMVRQTQVNTEAGLTFASALRSILRQDPDVVLVGEIRDAETAQIAVQAALTGHLVLSTLHTNDATGAVSRLRDFGVPPFAVSTSLLGVLAQRLVRTVCEHCSEPAEYSAAELAAYGIGEDESAGLRRGRGCGRCGASGSKGRSGVYEFVRVTPALRSAIAEGAPVSELAAVAEREGMRPLWKDGVAKALSGATTLEEAARLRVDDVMLEAAA